MDIKEEGSIGDINNHWYYRGKLAALHRMLPAEGPNRILDVGAGSGFFAESLLQSTNARVATCVDPGYPENRDDARTGKPLLFRQSIVQSDADLVLMMDVIEHVGDDAGLVREYADKVASGTRFIVSVPAFMWLWSGHDVFLGHYRRYTLTEIESVLRSAGLTIECGCYFYGAVLPIVALARVKRAKPSDDEARSQMREFGPLLNTTFWFACRTELPFFRANRLAGLTAFIRAVKSE